MTPAEKAKELIKKYYRDSDLLVEDLTWIQAKECAKIAIDEILQLVDEQMQGFFNSDIIAHWKQVKNEIENL